MRVKGQNVKVIPMVNGDQASTAFAFVKSIDMEFQHDIVTEDYLGMDTSLRSSTFGGVTGTVEVNFETKDIFDFLKAYSAKAKDQLGDISYDIMANITTPAGQTITIQLQKVFFGGIGVSAGDRKDFIGTTWPFEAENYDITTA